MTDAWPLYLLILAAAVLLTSGTLKLLDRPAFGRAVDGFTVLPGLAASSAKQALPIVEIVLGVLFLVTSGWVLVVVAWAAVALMLAFTALVGVTLARGERPSCHCFGAASAEPISGSTLLRNVALLVVAVVLAAALVPDDGLPRGLARASQETWSGLATLVLFSVAVVVLWVRQGRVLAAPAAGSVGADGAPVQPPSMAERPIPVLHLTSPAGVPTQLREMAHDRAQLLIYVSPTCTTCHQLVPLVADWQELLGDELDVRLVSIGDREESAEVYVHHLDRLWFDEEQGYGQLGVPGTPTAMLLGTNGTIAAGPAAGVPAIQELLGTVVQALGVNLMTGAAQQSHGHAMTTREEQANWVPDVGAPVADLTVVDEEGSPTSYPHALEAIARRAGVETLTTVAWRHDCSWCEGIVDEVREASARGDVVLVISEDPATVRAQGMTGPVLQVMGPGTAVEAVGVPGTPGAVPVRDGVVSGLGGIGTDHVLEVLAEFVDEGARPQR